MNFAAWASNGKLPSRLLLPGTHSPQGEEGLLLPWPNDPPAPRRVLKLSHVRDRIDLADAYWSNV